MLNKEQVVFIKSNKNTLNQIFSDLINDMKDRAFNMVVGQERDASIEAIKVLQAIMSDIEIISQTKKEETNKDFI